jgi:diguanylate cyclase (GGDEF)-like protein
MAHILLVDDDKIARAIYGDFLTGAGHQAVAVESAAQAKTSLAKHRFDVVVTDLLLPESDGMELLQHVKLHHANTEVLVITALDKVDPAVRAIKSGASDYLVKPVNPEVLAHAVTRALTTRALLKENESLRRHVEMLETGQRISTTLDREKLPHTTCAAFAQMCAADAALLVMNEDDAFHIEGSLGLSDEELQLVSSVMLDKVRVALGNVSPLGQAMAKDAAPEPFKAAFLSPALDGNKPLGAVVLLYKQPLNEHWVEATPFLARHLSLALRNLGRFAEVEDLAYLDDLTHLFNSRYLDLVLDKEVKNATPADKPFSLLFCDLDYFKSVNDAHGHVIGSKLLLEVARIIKGCVRDHDVVCRYGGDEYVVLLRGTDSGGALKVAERMRRSIETHHFLAREGFSLQITTCIGIATYPEHAQDKDTLIDFADRAMYRGKKSTRNIIYLAANGLEATPEARHQTTPPKE